MFSEEGRARIASVLETLTPIGNWSHAVIKDTISDYAARENIGFGKVGPLVRAALTGGKTAPDLGVTMEILGRDESLARLKDVAFANIG